MKTIFIIRNIYVEGFRDIGNLMVKHYFRAFAWFSSSMFLIVIYALIYRVSTGFLFA
tara:strand:+ start:972 stop:1142 length:171 start_codon:yes stop_codon:yes gene_type:complete